MKPTASITALFPAYNDAGTIASLVISSRRTLHRLVEDFEILVVNDGSQDHTAEVLEELDGLLPELRVIHHPTNRGYGAALQTGFAAATKELVFYTDGDAQFDPREIEKLLAAMEPDVDYVVGYRTRRADPIVRVAMGRPYHWLVRKAFGLQPRDVDCDFRLFRRSVLQRLALCETNGAFCIELLKKLQEVSCRFREVPVHHYPRVYGRSQYFTPRRVLRSYWQLLELWMRLVARRGPMEPTQALGKEVPATPREPRC